MCEPFVKGHRALKQSKRAQTVCVKRPGVQPLAPVVVNNVEVDVGKSLVIEDATNDSMSSRLQAPEITWQQMATNSSRSIIKHPLAPLILVITIWVGMSSITNIYLQWLERSHQRTIVDNIASIRAAETVENLVWRLVAECPAAASSLPRFRSEWKKIESDISTQRQRLTQAAFTADEREALKKLDLLLTELLQSFHDQLDGNDSVNANYSAVDFETVRGRATEFAEEIATSTHNLLKVNQESADRDAMRRQRVSRVVLTARTTTLIVGPVLGMLLGWRLSRLLHRSIARIAVTLNDAQATGDSKLGTIAIESSGDVEDLQQQAENVAERMRQVSRDLQVARREVLQQERLAAVGELAAGVAHEIRNPLTSVKLLLQHAIRQATGPRLNQSQIELILEEVRRMEATIQGLLDFSRPPKMNRIRHDVRQTLQRAINLVDTRAHQQRIEICAPADSSPLMVDGDTEKLHQLLVNLLINAIEAMPNGGQLKIDAFTTVRRSDTNGTQGASDERVVQITIRDTGPGIPDEILPRLFEPFSTSKERGTGLGLAISHRIIEEHSGSVHASNRSEGGAEFKVQIPAANDAKNE